MTGRIVAGWGIVDGLGGPPERASVRAAEVVAHYLHGHRREAAERGAAAADYRPPTLARVARHLAEDAGLRPPSGGAWAPGSVKALIERAEGLALIWSRQIRGWR